MSATFAPPPTNKRGALAVTAGDVETCKYPARLRRPLMKLRTNHGHATVFRPKKLSSRIPDMDTKAIIQADKVAKSRRACERVAWHPPIPRAGYDGASHLRGIAEIDLIFVEDPMAILYVDVATRSTKISKIDKELKTVWTDLQYTRKQCYGLLEQISCDFSGNIFPDW